jgi:hypothetical protein
MTWQMKRGEAGPADGESGGGFDRDCVGLSAGDIACGARVGLQRHSQVMDLIIGC